MKQIIKKDGIKKYAIKKGNKPNLHKFQMKFKMHLNINNKKSMKIINKYVTHKQTLMFIVYEENKFLEHI